jgi:hypothetical protein
MDSKKLVIVILIVIAVVFVIFAGYGSLTVYQPKRTNARESKKDAKVAPTPGWAKSIDSAFSGWQESVQLRCDPPPDQNSRRRCDDLGTGPIVVPPAKEPWLPLMKKTEFRTLKLVLLEGQRVHINYLDKKGGKNIDNPQFFNLPDLDNNNSLKGSIAVMENGGTLTISCLDNVPCRVGQE